MILTLVGLEPTIYCLEGSRLVHLATGSKNCKNRYHCILRAKRCPFSKIGSQHADPTGTEISA